MYDVVRVELMSRTALSTPRQSDVLVTLSVERRVVKVRARKRRRRACGAVGDTAADDACFYFGSQRPSARIWEQNGSLVVWWNKTPRQGQLTFLRRQSVSQNGFDVKITSFYGVCNAIENGELLRESQRTCLNESLQEYNINQQHVDGIILL